MPNWQLLITKFLIPIGIIITSVAGGWACRHFKLVREERARSILSLIIVFGYPPISFLAIWNLRINPGELILPLYAVISVIILSVCGLLLSGKLFDQRDQQGLFSLGCSMGNCGVTMAGFIIFLLMGERGLGLSAVMIMYYWPSMALLIFPIARHYSPKIAPQSFVKNLIASLFSIRSFGLVTTSTALVLSFSQIPRPELFNDYPIVKVMIYCVLVVVYFAIGLRLEFSAIGEIKKLICATIFMRHFAGLAIGLGIMALTLLLPWPLVGNSRTVFLIQCSIPVGVSIPIVANIHHISPKHASSLMIISSAAYLLIGLPLLLLLFGG